MVWFAGVLLVAMLSGACTELGPIGDAQPQEMMDVFEQPPEDNTRDTSPDTPQTRDDLGGPQVTDGGSPEDAAPGPEDAGEDIARDASGDDVRRDAPSTTDAAADLEEEPVEDVVEPTPDVTDITLTDWRAGPMPQGGSRQGLLPLPGGGVGGPVVTSNNPEVFTGPGLLFGTARPTQTRGGQTYPLEGDFGVYLHHLNRSGAPMFVTLMVTNPNEEAVEVEAFGSAWTQDETGGLPLGGSPDYLVSEAWLEGRHRTRVGPTSLASLRPLRVWSGRLGQNREVDGRFGIRTSAPVYVYIVATTTDDLNDALSRGLEDAPGDYRISGDPPPPFGREAGVYAHDRWTANFSVALPRTRAHIGMMVNTATGAGFSQVQAFPALMHYEGSAREAVGMYGNTYDLTVTLVHPGGDQLTRRVRGWFVSLATGQVSRYWDGAGLVNNEPVTIQHVPGDVSTRLFNVDVAPGQPTTVRFEAMVPGLTSIPQAFYLETY